MTYSKNSLKYQKLFIPYLDTSLAIPCLNSGFAWGNYINGNVSGFNLLESYGEGYGFWFDRNPYAPVSKSALAADINFDTLRNFGWSLELNSILSKNLSYELQLKTYFKKAWNGTDYFFEPMAMYNTYLRVGISDNPLIEGDSIGILDYQNFGFNNPVKGDIYDTINNPAYLLKIKFKPLTESKYLTFRFVCNNKRTITKPKPIPRNQFDCYQVKVYSGNIVLESFKINCLTTIISDSSNCFNGKTGVLLTNFPNAAHRWSTGESSNQITIYKPGVYWVETNNMGCIGRDTINIAQKILPVNPAGIDDTICFGQNYLIGSNPISSTANYVWNTGEITSKITITTKGRYSLVVQDSGCIVKDTIEIFEFPKNYIAINKSYELCMDSTYELNSGYVPSEWYRNGQLISSNSNLSYNPKKLDFLILKTIGQCIQQDTVKITGSICGTNELDEIFIPNAFTPNESNLNDMFYPVSKNWKLADLRIYDRWGQIIYSGETAWNGTFNNKACPEGVYIYRIKFEHAFLESIPFEIRTGTLNLIR
ncbi:MAG: gliding motility-associated C-terminal domain-containing protein [Bacteroidetes bacterium]|nr:gliding motility-associated C-terminal domain-containing protein [Bacteroidota bacterium]